MILKLLALIPMITSLIMGALLYLSYLRSEHLRLQNQTLLKSIEAASQLIDDREKKIRILQEHTQRLRQLMADKEQEVKRLERLFSEMREKESPLSPEEEERAKNYINSLFRSFNSRVLEQKR